MEEKKQIKVSLGTAILLFIIIILVVALGGMWFYFNNKVEEKNEDKIIENEIKQNIEEKDERITYKTLSIDTAKKKEVNSGISGYNIVKRDVFGLYLSIREGKVYFTSEFEKEKWVEYEVAKDKNDVKVSKNFETEITGFDKKIIDAQISCNGHRISDCYIVFLMEDGTLEYSSIKNVVTNLTTEGRVNIVSNIQRIYNCNVRWTDGGGKSSVIALDHENNMYDIGYILYDKNIANGTD